MIEFRPAKSGKRSIVSVNGKRDSSLEGLSAEEIAKTLAERRAKAKPATLAKRRMVADIAEREAALKKARTRRV